MSDNGSAFVDAWLLRACAVLGIKLVHSRPGRPQGRGKVERFFGTVREQFLVEIAGDGRQAGTRAADLAELNRLFDAWVQAGYHRAVHSETGEPPLARWAKGISAPLPLPSPGQLREAFLWSERRTVKKTATVSLHGNLYQVDASLVRCTVELVFDPFDLTDIQVRHKGQPAGKAVPFLIGRHRHAKTRAEDGGQRTEPEPTGIDYLRILDAAHGAELQAQINYAALITPGQDSTSPGPDSPSQEQGNKISVDFRQVIDLDQLTGDDTVTLARTAAEALRGLNWVTRHQAGLGQPGVAYDILAALSLAASRMPQLLTQITGYLGRALAAGRLGHDLGEDPAHAIGAAVVFLGDARGSAAALAGDLDAAWQQLSLINGRPVPRASKDRS